MSAQAMLVGSDADEAPWTAARLEEQGVRLRIVNMLAHGSLRAPVDVKQLALLVRNASYSPKGFSALVLRFQVPRATVLVYRSGKFLVVGATSLQDAHAALDKYLAILQKVGFPSELRAFEVANVVGSADVRFKVRLEGLARSHSRFCTVHPDAVHLLPRPSFCLTLLCDELEQYEPELFPGLIYRMLDPKCTLLIFVSGKIVVTGCKESSENHEALAKIYPVLLQFRLRSSSSSDEDDDNDDDEEEDDVRR